MDTAAMLDQLQRLLDEAEVRRVVDGISIAVDDKAWETCRAYFKDEIMVDFTSLTGGSPSLMKADDLVFGGWQQNLFAEKHSHHMHAGHQIAINGDRATCFSKGVSWNKLTRPLGTDLWEVWGNYRHEFERTETGWTCSGIAFFATHGRGNEKVREFMPEAQS